MPKKSKGGVVKHCRRWLARALMLAVVVLVFTMIHLQYIDSVRHHERLYTIPENLMLFSPRQNATKAASPKRSSDSISVCQPRRGVVFLKTHKTGSTTMTNILLRYAEKHQLVVGLPPYRKWELAGYPAFFNKRLIDPQLKRYDMLCHHFRMDKYAVSEVVRPDSVYVTIMRDPANSFESGFSFFRDGPYSVWMPDYQNPSALQKFLDEPRKYYDRSTPWYFRAKNYETFDFGFDNDRDDDDFAQSVVRDIDRRFNLVMITERFEESLILLKDLLCMDDLSDVMNIRLKVRQNSTRRSATEKMQEQMRQWNKIDNAIYTHFLQKLEEKVEEYGRGRMAMEVEELRKMNQATEERCVREYDQGNLRYWMSRIKLKRNSGELCEKLSWGEVRFGDHIREKQKNYANIPPELQISPEEMKMQLEIEQEKIVGKKRKV